MGPLLRKRNRFAQWYESTSRPQYFLIGLILALYAPSLASDFMLDDHRMLRVFREYREGARTAPNAYQFLDGGESNEVERAAGWYPWWLPSELKYRHFRPLSERILYGEYLLFGEKPTGFRLAGIALYVAGVLLVLKFFRLVGGDERLARWGALIFAVAGCHAIPVTFISAHCDILALVLAAAGALFALRYLIDGGPAPLMGSLFFLVAGLFSKEAMLPMILWPVAAGPLVRDQPGAARRARILTACWWMLGIAWLALYVSAKCGTNTSLMLDPVAAPADYLRQAPLRVALLLSTWIIPLNPFLLEFQLNRGDLLIYYAAFGAILLSAIVVMFLIHHRRQRGVLPMAIWSTVFLPILICTPPDDRVMVLPSIGLAFLASAWMTRPHDNGSFKLRKLPLAQFVWVQVILSAATISVMGFMEHSAQNHLRAMADAFHRPIQNGDHIFIVNGPYPFDGLFMQDRLRRVFPNVSAGVRLLTDVDEPMATRIDARTIRLESNGDRFFEDFLGRMGTVRHHPHRIGDEFDAGVMKCRVVGADDRGVNAVEIEFAESLESPSYRFFLLPPGEPPRPWPVPPAMIGPGDAGATAK